MSRRAGGPAGQGAFGFWADPTPRPGWYNMAIDAELLARAERGERWLRLYAWEPCLSFGRHEPAARRYDADGIAARGLAVVRRPTGGRAVWHANELTYALAAPADGLGPLRETYLAIHRVLRDALRSLGADAELAPDRAAGPLDGGACFAAAAGGEVLLGGRKVIGSAQLRQGSALLQHGSVLLGDDQRVVAAVSRGTAAADHSLPLSRALGRPISWAEAAEAVRDAAQHRWGLRPPEDGVACVLRHALAHADRFRSEAWTWAGMLAR
jgi:lipoyl(octanoyl) transferase